MRLSSLRRVLCHCWITSTRRSTGAVGRAFTGGGDSNWPANSTSAPLPHSFLAEGNVHIGITVASDVAAIEEDANVPKK